MACRTATATSRRRLRRTASTRRAATTAGSPSPAAATATGARWARSWLRSGPRTLASSTLAGRLTREDELDGLLGDWTRPRDAFETAAALQAAGVPATAVQRPQERVDHDPNTAPWGLWPAVEHTEMGTVRVDGLPVHFSETDWEVTAGAPCLGEHNDEVFGGLLGLSAREIASLRDEGAI